MSDWADEKAKKRWIQCYSIIGVDVFAEDLRQARLDALEDAAKALAAEDERHAEIIVRSLKDKA